MPLSEGKFITNMDIYEVIKNRRSIRIFQDKPVEKHLIEQIIEAATYAPSACNIQGWKFIVVDKPDLKDKIFDYGGSILIKKAPMGILVVYDNRTKNTEYQDYIQSAAAAIQNLHLAAINLGLGTCWNCHLPTKKRLRKLFNIPSYFSPIAYILVGYPKNQPREVQRKYTLPQIMAYNKFSSDWPTEKVNPIILLIKKILVKIYYMSPTFIKKKLLNKFLDENFVKKFEN